MKLYTTIAMLLCSFQAFSQARPGMLDSTFGVNGIVTDSFGRNTNFLNQILLTSDEKIVGVGDTTYGSAITTTLKRYLPNGSVDMTFGNHGLSVFTIDSASTFCQAAGLQADGKIIGTGIQFYGSYYSLPMHVFVFRDNADGSLDTTFGTRGYTIVAAPTGYYHALGYRLAIQKDGKIIVGGVLTGSGASDHYCVFRFNANGGLDTTFNGSGMQIAPPSPSAICVTTDVKVLDNGKIVLTGYHRSGTTSPTLEIMRINADGAFDSTFGDNGLVARAYGTTDIYGLGLAEQPDNKLVAVMLAYNSAATSGLGDYLLTRLNENGSTDSSWGDNGVVQTHFYPNMISCFLDIKTTGKLLMGCTHYDSLNLNYPFAIARFNNNGSLDTTFGNYGIAMAPEVMPKNSDYDRATDMVIDLKSKSIILSGTSDNAVINLLKFKLEYNASVATIKNNINEIKVYPNPVYGTCRVYFNLKNPCSPYIVLNDVTGRLISIVSAGKPMRQGDNELNINLSNLLPGNYYLNILSEGESKTIKIVRN
ncbi:MAG: T9SS type A sorting domain-containing protein [Flavipsychrobacter sp.]